MDESIGTERAFDIIFRGGIKREGGKVFYPGDDFNTKISRSIEHIAGGIVPGAFKSAQRIWEGATGKFTDAGTVRDMGTELIAVTSGIRVEDAKPLASMPFIVTSYNKDKQNVDRKFAEIAYRPSATMEQRLDAYKNYLIESYDSQNKMYQTLKDATTIGIDEGDVKDIVQSRLNNKKETESLFNGVFKVPTYNEKAFDSLIKRLEKENPKAAIQVENQIDIVKEIYKDMNKEFQIKMVTKSSLRRYFHKFMHINDVLDEELFLKINNSNILIIDDSFGSGVTMREAARAIKHLNPKELTLLSCFMITPLQLKKWLTFRKTLV